MAGDTYEPWIEDRYYALHERTPKGERGRLRVLLIWNRGKLWAFGELAEQYRENWERIGDLPGIDTFDDFVARGRDYGYNIVTYDELNEEGKQEALAIAREMDEDIKDALI